jgi:L-alanine-DL-glutamate epimerase-like enolase superfamily enzyme
MKITELELIHLDVPFEPHTNQHMQYWLPHWRISQLCKITLENGVVGWGETIPNYTWAKVPDKVAERVVGREAADLLWEDDLGAGVQMALFDAVGKLLNVPAYRLLGNKKVREWCPISWWAMDMPPHDWAQQCVAAVRQGYMSAKLKARTWYDLHAALQAIFKVVPEQFILDLDFNATLDNSANAVKFLSTLTAYAQVAMFESPIPQEDVAGNVQIRQRINRPVAMHYGSPPIMTTLQADVADGFVLCAGAANLLKQAHICEEANKPFWLQLVGTGVTTAWAAHFGAALLQAKWPAITCMNIWESQLLAEPIQIHGGFMRVPEAPGLGITIDQRAVEKYRVDYTWVNPPKHVYRYARANGEITYYGCGKQELHRIYPDDAQPICEPGSSLDVLADDGSAEFAQLHATVQAGHVLRRQETALPTATVITTERMPSTKAELLAALETNWTALRGLLERLSPAQMSALDPNGWSIKDHIAHLVPWARGMAALLAGHSRWAAMGIDEAARQANDLDALNTILQQQAQAKTLSQVLAELTATHQELLAALGPLSDADLYRPYNDYAGNQPLRSGGEQAVIHRVVGNTVDHYVEHLAWIKTFTQQ